MSDIVDKTEGASDIIRWWKLDKRVISLWKIQSFIGLSILYIPVFIVGTALWLFTPFPGFVLLLLFLSAILLFYLNIFWLPKRRYLSWSYRLTDNILEFRSGIIIQKSVMIPLSRLQHADLIRGPIEQRLGLSSLKIHTAGTYAASHAISGLEAEAASKLRDDLIAASKLKLRYASTFSHEPE